MADSHKSTIEMFIVHDMGASVYKKSNKPGVDFALKQTYRLTPIVINRPEKGSNKQTFQFNQCKQLLELDIPSFREVWVERVMAVVLSAVLCGAGILYIKFFFFDNIVAKTLVVCAGLFAFVFGAYGFGRLVEALANLRNPLHEEAGLRNELAMNKWRKTNHYLWSKSQVAKESSAGMVVEPANSVWTPTNPRFASHLPLSDLLHIFIFTGGAGKTILDSQVAAGILEDTIEAPLKDFMGKVSMDVIANSEVAGQIAQTRQMPEAAWVAMSRIDPAATEKARADTYRSVVRVLVIRLHMNKGHLF